MLLCGNRLSNHLLYFWHIAYGLIAVIEFQCNCNGASISSFPVY